MTARKHEPETVPLCALLERKGPQVRWADPHLKHRDPPPSPKARHTEPATTAIDAAALGALLDRSKGAASEAGVREEPRTRALRVRGPHKRRPSTAAGSTVAIVRPSQDATTHTELIVPGVRRARWRVALIAMIVLAALVALLGSIAWSEASRHETSPAATPARSTPAAASALASPPSVQLPASEAPRAASPLPAPSTSRAVAALAEGRYRDAIAHYRVLDQTHPEQPAYGAIAAILTRELSERCARGALASDPECAP